MREFFGATGATRAELREVAGLEKSTFYRVLNQLVDEKLIVKSGTPARPFYQLPEDAEE